SRNLLVDLLNSLPQRFSSADTRGSALGPAITASLAALASRGGQVVTFAASYSSIGCGSLSPRDVPESTLYGTDKEPSLFVPRETFWRELGEECAEQGVGVNLFLCPSEPVEIGTIGTVASLTGGDIFFYPRYNPSLDELTLLSQLRRLFTRETAYNCIVRVRCSKGLRVSDYLGNIYQRSTLDVDIATCDSDKAICASFEHSGVSLDDRGNAYIQSAILYTTSSGERRVRTCNIAVPVCTLAGNVYRHTHQETLITYWTKQAIAEMSSRPLQKIRDDLTQKCAAILLSYRKNCAASTPPSQLILPEQLKLLPIFTLTITKNRALKGRNVVSDVRNYHAHRLVAFGVRPTMNFLYPQVLALHDLMENVCFPDQSTGRVEFPALMRDSYVWMQNNGLYLSDNEEQMILWIGGSISPQLLQDLYGVESMHELDPLNVRDSKPPLGTATLISTQLHNILLYRESRRGRKIKFTIARQDLDASEIDFSDMLVEDKNNDAMSYVDYLCFVHKQIDDAVS
ncbi:hypothetical protein M422DRAFT_82882, partial [Sphaerobolus stellatus SS14]